MEMVQKVGGILLLILSAVKFIGVVVLLLAESQNELRRGLLNKSLTQSPLVQLQLDC